MVCSSEFSRWQTNRIRKTEDLSTFIHIESDTGSEIVSDLWSAVFWVLDAVQGTGHRMELGRGVMELGGNGVLVIWELTVGPSAGG